jgi:hypothetical protein
MTRRRLGQPGEHLRYIPAGQLGEPDPAEVRDQMPVDVVGVGPQRGRPDAPSRGQPPRQPPAHRPGLGGRLLRRAFQQIPGGLGGPSGREPAAADSLGTGQHRGYRAVEVPGTVTPLPEPGTAAFQPTPRLPIPATTPLEHQTPCRHGSSRSSICSPVSDRTRMSAPCLQRVSLVRREVASRPGPDRAGPGPRPGPAPGERLPFPDVAPVTNAGMRRIHAHRG